MSKKHLAGLAEIIATGRPGIILPVLWTTTPTVTQPLTLKAFSRQFRFLVIPKEILTIGTEHFASSRVSNTL